MRSLGELPPFSPILNRLLATLAQDDVSFARLAELIEKDTVVAGNVLHLVNSALYARRGTVNSVRHAVSLLGVNKLRNAVLGMSVSRMWRQVRTPPGWSMARFNMHSAASAILCDLLAQRLPVDYPEGAFVAGLFHDVGRLLIAIGLRDELEEILEAHRNGHGNLVACERDIIGVTHPELSAAAVAAWNLPRPVQVAVEFHHAPDLDPSELAPGEVPLSRTVWAANAYANRADVSILQETSSDDGADERALEYLGLGDALPQLLAEFEAEFRTMTQFFR